METSDFLNECRQKGDLLADEYLDSLPPLEVFKAKPENLNSNIQVAWKNETNLGEVLRSNFTTRPSQGFYKKNRPQILFILGMVSLPYCYAAAKGAKVIYFSDKMRNSPLSRLKDTALFVEAVCQPHSDEKLINELISQVRWKHAQVRSFMKRQSFWNKDWGLPINQEDLAGTNLSFSVVLLRGLRKMGVPIAPEEANNYFQLWSCVGKSLGIEESCLPEDLSMALDLEKTIKKRHFFQSEESIWLTKSLNQSLNKILGFGDSEKIMSALLEPEVAEVLSLQPVSFSPIQKTIVNSFLRWKTF